MSWKLDDFFQSTFDKNLFVKLPERGDDNLTAATKLLEIRREMTEIEQALAAQKDEFQLKMGNLQRRREDLLRKEFLLKESLLKFDRFVKENDAKRQRAVKRQSDERDSRNSKEKEIDSLKDRCASLEGTKNVVIQRLKRYAKFQTFLEKIVESSSEFSEIRELMGRYDTLITTHETLLADDQENQLKMQTEKHQQHLFVEEKLNEKLRATALLSELQDQIDSLESDCHRLETAWQQIQDSAASRTLQIGRIKMATYNIFQHVQRIHAEHNQEVPDRAEADTNGQLKVIQRCVMDLDDISNHARQLVLDDYHHMGSSRATSLADVKATAPKTAQKDTMHMKTERSRP